MFEMTSAIPLWFEQQVCRTPDHLAVKTRQQAITYAALNQLANEIAFAGAILQAMLRGIMHTIR